MVPQFSGCMTSASAGVVDKKLEVVEDAEMMVSNDITAILGHIH